MSSEDWANLRRQVYELSLRELLEVPAWEFASDEEGVLGQDEATVRPYGKAPINPDDGLLVVRAIFKLADGSELLGYVSPPPLHGPWDLGGLQPVIVAEGGQVPLWFGMFRPPADRICGFLKTLGKSAAEMFPLSYKADAPILGDPVQGEVAGFSFLNQGKVEVTPM